MYTIEKTTVEPGIESIESWLVSKISALSGIRYEDIDTGEAFSYYGLDSVAAVSLSGELQDWLGRRLSPTLVYDYPTIDSLARHLSSVS
jgi:acyl carrier protein